MQDIVYKLKNRTVNEKKRNMATMSILNMNWP